MNRASTNVEALEMYSGKNVLGRGFQTDVMLSASFVAVCETHERLAIPDHLSYLHPLLSSQLSFYLPQVTSDLVARGEDDPQPVILIPEVDTISTCFVELGRGEATEIKELGNFCQTNPRGLGCKQFHRSVFHCDHN